MSKKITYDDYIKLENEKNIKFLDINKTTIPKNTVTPTHTKCNECGYDNWFPIYNNLKRNKSGCPNCSNKAKKTYDDYIKLEKDKNIKFIDLTIYNIPNNSKTPIQTKCNKCGYSDWFPCYSTLKNNGFGCPECAVNSSKKYDDYIKLEKDKNIKFLDINKTTIPKNTASITKIMCNKCKNVWNSSYTKIKYHNNICSKCDKYIRKTYNDYVELENNKNIKFINLCEDNLPTVVDKIKTKCNKCGNIWYPIYYNLKTNEQGCPNCNSGKGEKISNIIFSKLFNNIFLKTRYKKLKNPKTGSSLELDGFCKDLNLAIEYQGYQHYKYPNHFHKTKKEFLNLQERDKLKESLCKKLGITLFFIQEFKIFTVNNIYDSILESLNNNCIKLSKDKDLYNIIEQSLEEYNKSENI